VRQSRTIGQALGGVGKSFWNAWEGLVYALYTQEHMRFHFFAAILAVSLGVILGLDHSARAVLFGVICLLLGMEVVNTSVESAMDHVTRELLPLIKRAKDAAAGAVLLAAFGAIVVCGYLMLPEVVAIAKDPDWLAGHWYQVVAFVSVPIVFGLFLLARNSRSLGAPVKFASPAAASFAFSAICHPTRDVFSFLVLVCGSIMLFNSMIRGEQAKNEREHIDLHPRHDLPDLRFVVAGELVGFVLWVAAGRAATW
jgi:diacylglycerol kinase